MEKRIQERREEEEKKIQHRREEERIRQRREERLRQRREEEERIEHRRAEEERRDRKKEAEILEEERRLIEAVEHTTMVPIKALPAEILHRHDRQLQAEDTEAIKHQPLFSRCRYTAFSAALSSGR